ncbi:DUF1295 domain-containing protein [Breoghania sp. L-A4]|uniref:DUF1295 domain-containing protein n=1 Tax=Breoghania sp. L-A4 TaxID=2304600 RepID=UPI000E35E09C|nr:DUF1295 domain-containing protein [Breoghania sp. L-A4]AXS39322.1 DUF1295 domain-containing protein [Breoghania sp. L-A4]
MFYLTPEERVTGKKVFAFLYGAIVYAGVWGILLYIVGFVGNFFGPLLDSEWADVIPFKSIDMGKQEPLWLALTINFLLLAILATQHSVMPRKFWKRFITRIVTKHLERSTYVIFAICALSLLIWQWRPITITVWQFENPVLVWGLNAISVGGWLLVLYATFQVGHWKIFGVAQVMDYIQDKPYTNRKDPTLTPEFYKASWPKSDVGVWNYSRHPDFLGFIIAFWATPHMTVGHLQFALTLTLYIMLGIFLLERNMVELYGAPFKAYLAARNKLIPGRPRTEK